MSYWNGNGGLSNAWDYAYNWNPSGVPGHYDTAYISIRDYYSRYTVNVYTDIDVHGIEVQSPEGGVWFYKQGGQGSLVGDFINKGESAIVSGYHLSVGGDFNNTGLFFQEGGSLSVAGKFRNAGRLDLDGDSDPGSATLQAGRFVNLGVVNMRGGDTASGLSQLIDADIAPSSLGGTYVLSGYALLQYHGGAIATVAGDISIDGPNARIAIAGDDARNSALDGLTAVTGRLALADGASLSLASLNISGGVNLDAGVGNGGTSLTVAGNLAISGYLDMAAPGFAETVTCATLSNTGTLYLNGGAGRATFIDQQDVLPSTLAAGGFFLIGNALAQFSGGTITAIAEGATIWLDGPQAFLADKGHTARSSAVAGLHDNAGTLGLGDGAALANSAFSFNNSGTFSVFNGTAIATALDFTNSGTLKIDAPGANGGSSLIVAGTLANSGTLLIGNASLNASDKVVVTTLDNTGTIDLEASSTGAATLKVKGDAGNSGDVTIGAYANLTRAHSYTQSAGTTHVKGTMTLPDVFIQDGVLDGTGKINASVVVSGAGAISGGDVLHAKVGTLSIHGKLVDSGIVDAILDVHHSGSASLIDVSGNKVSLRGATLDVHIDNPASLHAGEVFTILTFTPGILTYGFSAMTDGTHTGDGNVLDLGNGISLDASYDNAAGRIQLTAVTTESHNVPAEDAPAHHLHALHVGDWL